MAALAERDPAFAPENRPVVSCDLMECELDDIAAGSATGQLCAASYFDSLDSMENREFKARVALAQGAERRISSVFASAYAAAELCIGAIIAAASDEPQMVRRHLHAATWQTPLGPLSIDSKTNHAALPFHLGRINRSNGFDVVVSKPALAADPYLTARGTHMQSRLRVVS
jgi:branched-chain amino acid transport system substrate-binding protein